MTAQQLRRFADTADDTADFITDTDMADAEAFRHVARIARVLADQLG